MNNWRPPSLSELTPIIFYMELTHLGSVPPVMIVIMIIKPFNNHSDARPHAGRDTRVYGRVSRPILGGELYDMT